MKGAPLADEDKGRAPGKDERTFATADGEHAAMRQCAAFELSPRMSKVLEMERDSSPFRSGSGVWRPVSMPRQRPARSGNLSDSQRTSPSSSVHTPSSSVVHSPYSDSQSSTDESEISQTSNLERSPSPPISPDRDRMESDKMDCLNMPPPAFGPLTKFHRAQPIPISRLGILPATGPHVPIREEHASDSEASCRSTPPGDISRSSKGKVPAADSAKLVESSPETTEQSGKKRRREKHSVSSASRLSFSDDLESSESSDSSITGVSMSKATQKRFRQEERSRRHNPTSSLHTSSPISSSSFHPGHDAIPQSLGRIVDDDAPANARPLARVSYDVCERQGKRPYMEDKFFVIGDYLSPGSHLFGVFDGHGGSRASEFSCSEMPTILTRHLALHGIENEQPWISPAPAGAAGASSISGPAMSGGRGEPMAAGSGVAVAAAAACRNGGGGGGGGVGSAAGDHERRESVSMAMSAAFLEVDRLFLDVARTESLRDGTTVLLALLLENQLHVGWVGDSRGILCRQGRFVRVSEDHKPDRPEERRAVEARGGTIIFRGTYRVAGPTALAVSRAIGDILMKEPRKLVVADPETRCFDLTPQDEFLVMASDGLFDVMNDQSVVDTVSKHLREHGNCCAGAAERLAEMALEKGSTDNVTVLVVRFLWSPAPDDSAPAAEPAAAASFEAAHATQQPAAMSAVVAGGPAGGGA